jgi:hypothetical protein
VDITFYEYLRGLITADLDLVVDDPYNYRLAFLEAFRQRGILPYQQDLHDTVPLAVETLRWRGIDLTVLPRRVQNHFRRLVNQLKRYADACFYLADRRTLFQTTRRYRLQLQNTINALVQGLSPDEASYFGQLFGLDVSCPLVVHELRRSNRIGPHGNYLPQIMVALTQARPFSQPVPGSRQVFRGGSTLVLDLTQPAIKYAIFKNIASRSREARTQDFLATVAADPLRALLLDRQEPFAVLHNLSDG